MENASKALIMAASVLIALALTSVVIYMYNQITGIEQAKSDVQKSEKFAEYSQKFTQYNRVNEVIYGSELLSLANLQEEFNDMLAGDDAELGERGGYEEMQVFVNLHNSIDINTEGVFPEDNINIHINAGSVYLQDIKESLKDVREKLSNIEKTTCGGSKTIKQLALMSYQEIAVYLGIYTYAETSTKSNQELVDAINAAPSGVDLFTKIEKYIAIKTDYTQFKQKKFKCTEVSTTVDESSTGRSKMTFNKMIFEEI